MKTPNTVGEMQAIWDLARPPLERPKKRKRYRARAVGHSLTYYKRWWYRWFWWL